MNSDDRIWFEIPIISSGLLVGKAQVRVPAELNAEEAAHLARVIAAVLAAMFPETDR